MTAATHLIRVEGVNLYAVLNDTNKISVRRGASAMLRTAAHGIPQQFPTVQPVTFEASAGIFEAVTDDPDSLVQNIAAHLSQRYPHVTFVVDSAPLHNGYAAALDEAWARNRFRQFQQPTIAIPEDGASAGQVCEVDRVRPVSGRNRQQRPVSRSVDDRWEEGRMQRQQRCPVRIPSLRWESRIRGRRQRYRRPPRGAAGFSDLGHPGTSRRR